MAGLTKPRPALQAQTLLLNLILDKPALADLAQEKRVVFDVLMLDRGSIGPLVDRPFAGQALHFLERFGVVVELGADAADEVLEVCLIRQIADALPNEDWIEATPLQAFLHHLLA